MKSKSNLHVWAGSQCGGSALCSPSHKMQGHSLTSPQARSLHRSLQYKQGHIQWGKQWGLSTFKATVPLFTSAHITFSSKIRLKRFLLFEIFEDLDDTVALSNGISINLKKKNVVVSILLRVGNISPIFNFSFQTAYLLRGVMCPDKLLCWTKALVPQSHGSVDDVLSVSTHHNEPGVHKNAQMSHSCSDRYLKVYSSLLWLQGLEWVYVYLPLGLCWMVWG